MRGPTGAMTAIAIAPAVGAAVVSAQGERFVAADVLRDEVARIEDEEAPRWVWWSKSTAVEMLRLGTRPARCWDLSAVHRLIAGGWEGGPERIWALQHGLDPSTLPVDAPVDLFTRLDALGSDDDPIRPDGHLRPDWVAGAWATTPERIARWASLAFDLYTLQDESLTRSSDGARRRTTAISESAAESICAELEEDGLPVDRSIGEGIIAGFVGPRPRTPGEDHERLVELDRSVLDHLPSGSTYDLRSPDQVRSLLRRVGIEVPDTRAWRLEGLRDAHPIVDPLLAWRRAERIRTTFGYPWLDEHVGADGRLRGRWSGSDGAAGRMTATAGLHNMPAELRPAIVAEPGHVFVRSDLGQIEPRVLAAVSGDDRLARATHDDDMYAPVAARLGVDREIAKVAVLGAMYGQTTGRGAQALRGLEREYPIAMGHLRAADVAAQGGNDVFTSGGRRIRMSAAPTDGADDGPSDDDSRSRAAARGRYGRNAIVQGAAAEFFKTWAALVRARCVPFDARIVLCLHDELIVHTPRIHASDVASLVDACVDEAARRWTPITDGRSSSPGVRFVTDTSIVERWSDAKPVVGVDR